MLCAVEPGLDPFNTFSIEILLLGIAVLAAVGALSFEHEQPFSAAMVYVGIGVAGAVAIAAFDVKWLDPMADAGVIRHIAELALIVALFETGLALEEPLRSRWWRPPALLLAIGMTLTVAAVVAFGALAMGLSLAAAIALGAILAPTDPVLAGGIGTEPSWERGEREKSRARLSRSSSRPKAGPAGSASGRSSTSSTPSSPRRRSGRSSDTGSRGSRSVCVITSCSPASSAGSS
jgi:sodium/hydrogen antiporter